MNTAEFEAAVSKGQKYVILDEFVLDISTFIEHHPGGKFVLKKCVGRDISKYFHGGYNFEGNLGPEPERGHKHTNYARKIVNQLIIAQFEKDKVVQSTICKVDKPKKHDWNYSLATHTLTSNDLTPVPGFKKFYPGLSNCGKHFMVRMMIPNPEEGRKWRHYTIASVMERDVYHKYMTLLGKGLNSSMNSTESKKNLANIDLADLLPTQDQNSMIFTVKNYRRESCVSEKFFRKSGALEFEVKGPLGKGLQVQKTGVHVAFAAGTGVLTFMDLVAHIAATNLNMNGKLGVDPNDCISDGFKLVLHVAYKQKIDALGLEMMERLRKFCENNNFNNFELFVKITKEGINPARWDQAFIRKRLEEYGGAEGIKKIWVVGPPVMTETFERAFENLPEYKKFSEIL